MATKPRPMIRVTPEMVAKAMAETDWARIDAMTDDDIAAQVAADPDAAPILTDEQWAAARIRSIRRRLNLTQAAFATRLRIPLGTVRDWEQGRRRAVSSRQPLVGAAAASTFRTVIGGATVERIL